MWTFTRRQIAEVLEVDEGFVARLEQEHIVVVDTLGQDEFSSRMLERARVAHSLIEELEINLAGVAVIVRMREELASERARVDALLHALRTRRSE